MNKIALVVGVAAVATLSGCKDPDYLKPYRPEVQDEVKQVEAAPEAEQTETVDVVVVEEAPRCMCPAGTVHQAPCKCGATDCKCKVAPPPAPVQETTPYIVQRGDTLSGISKRYNIKLQAIRDANPKLKGDKLLLGTTIKLPGKVNVGEQTKPAMAAPAKKAGEKTTGKSSQATTYTGETVEYTVKEGDTLGKVAYGHGINIRQLKSLNGISGSTIRVGQKLKVPAAVAKAEAKAAPQPEAAKSAEPVQLTIAPQRPAAEAPAEAPVVEETAPAEAPAVPQVATMDYTVQDGDDITGISIQYGVAAAKIRELNGLEEGDQLKVGQVIKLPADNQ